MEAGEEGEGPGEPVRELHPHPLLREEEGEFQVDQGVVQPPPQGAQEEHLLRPKLQGLPEEGLPVREVLLPGKDLLGRGKGLLEPRGLESKSPSQSSGVSPKAKACRPPESAARRR